MGFLLLIIGIFTFIIFLSIVNYLNNKKRSVAGWHVVITGGSCGIGKSLAIEVAKHGANVTIIARDEKKLLEARDEIQAHCKSNQRVIILPLNVTQAMSVIEKEFKQLEDSAGPIDMFVNCAGSAICGKIEDTKDCDFRHMLELNVLGTVVPTQIVARSMMKRKSGCIVITGSQASLVGIFGMSAYCTSKAALRGFAETLHVELAPHNVSVTFLLPPDTNTPGFEIEQIGKPEETKKICEVSKLAEPGDVAKHLLNDALKGHFWSSPGFEGFVFTTLCAGLSPIDSVIRLVIQICCMSFFRLIGAFYIFNMKRIIISLKK